MAGTKPTGGSAVETDEAMLARRFVEAAWGRGGDYQTIEDLAGPEFSAYYPLMPTEIMGAADYCEFLREVRVGMPDMHFTFDHLASQDSTAVFRFQGGGTHTGELL